MKYVFTLALLLLFLHYGNCKQSEINYVILNGACFDYNKGPNISTDVYSITDGKKQHLGISNEAGVYRVKVPLSSTFLVFKSPGFHEIKLPVRFIGKAKSEVEFLFDLPATQLDSAVVSIEDALYIGTAKSLSEDYTVQFLKKECVVEFPKQMIERGHRGAFMGVTEKSPSIDVLVTSSSEEIIMQKQIQVGKGLNLLLIDGIQPGLDSGNEKARIALPFTKNVYFNQTEYKLNKSSIMVLDSIIEIIKTNGKFAVSITGYTDHIGEEAKNLTLSEYRTRTVAKYLKDKGIKDSRITTNWLGSAGLVSKSEPEKNRRVVIQVTPE